MNNHGSVGGYTGRESDFGRQRRVGAGVTRLDRALVRKMLSVVGDPPVRILLWEGSEASPPCEAPEAVLRFFDRGALIKTVLNPELYWGDLYCSGRVAFEGNLTRFMETIYRGIRRAGEPGKLRGLLHRLGHRRIYNSPRRARANIHHHYDIGNAFYALWLDELMQYTCAYFPEPDLSLEQAQIAKLHHVCRKLDLKPGETVVEAGCGWGGLALFMAKHYGVRVRAYNISKAQMAYARERAEREGVSGQVEYVLDDYRNLAGQYDAFVSVGMLEHVGTADYEKFGALVRGCLKPGGRGLIHAIGRQSPGPMNAWIERRIFPGARPPALSEFMRIFEPNALTVYDVENLRPHYARTLEHWEERFLAQRDTVLEMTDEAFFRAWNLYLAGSIAAFTAGSLQLYQVLFTHADNNAVPRSREYIYRKRETAAAGG